MKNGVDSQPQFDVYHRVENHTIQLGATAFLPCIIKNLGNRSVRITLSCYLWIYYFQIKTLSDIVYILYLLYSKLGFLDSQ